MSKCNDKLGKQAFVNSITRNALSNGQNLGNRQADIPSGPLV